MIGKYPLSVTGIIKCSYFDNAEVFGSRVEQSLATWIWWRREIAPAFTNPLIRIFRDDHGGIREL